MALIAWASPTPSARNFQQGRDVGFPNHHTIDVVQRNDVTLRTPNKYLEKEKRNCYASVQECR